MHTQANRREFMLTALGAAAVAGGAGVAGVLVVRRRLDRLRDAGREAIAGGGAVSKQAANSSGANFKFAIKLGMMADELSLLQKFQLAKDIGYDGIELLGPSDLNRDEVLRARDRTGLAIHGVIDAASWQRPLSDPAEAVQAAARDDLRRAIDDAKAYGASTVLLIAAVVNAKVAYDDAYVRSQANIRQLLPYAEQQGIQIAIENVWNGFLLSPLEFARYIDEFQSPWIGAYFDIGNVVKFGWPQQWIRILGPRIIKVDVKDYNPTDGLHAKLGEGNVDWPAIRQAFADIGYQGFATAELRGGDREYLEDVFQRMNRLLRS